MGCAKKKMAKGGMVKRRKVMIPGYATGGFAVSDDPFFAPDPNMYRDPVKNMANVASYIQEQGGTISGPKGKPTAADLLGKFQAGQPLDGTTEQPTAPAAAPTPPATPVAPPRNTGGLGINLDNSMGLSTLSAPSSGVSGASPAGISTGLGQPMSKLGQYKRGGKIMDYRQGGPVAGGPPGVDTVPAMLNNGEYVLPRPTTQAMGGKPALDQAVLATTGKPPVGYAQGGMPVRSTYDQLRLRGQDVNTAVDRMTSPPPAPPGFSGPQYPAQARTRPAPKQSEGVLGGGMPGMERQYAQGGQVSGWNVDRAAQIENAVNGAMGQPPMQAAPVVPPPVEQAQAPVAVQPPPQSKFETLLRAMTGKPAGYAMGGQVQGYAAGGGPPMTAEEVMRQIGENAYGGRGPAPALPNATLGNAIVNAANNASQAVVNGVSPLVDRANSALTAARASAPKPTPTPMMASGYGTAPAAPSRPQAGYAPDVAVPAAMPPAPALETAASPERSQGSIGSRALYAAGKAISGMFPGETPEEAQDRADRTRKVQPVAPPKTKVVPSKAPTLTPAEQSIMALKPSAKTQDIPVSRPVNEGPGAPVSTAMRPIDMRQANANFRQNVAAIPEGGTERQYGNTKVYMSRDPKTGQPIFSNISAEAATPAGFETIKAQGKLGGSPFGDPEQNRRQTEMIREQRNERRFAEGSPPVGGWPAYMLEQQQRAAGAKANQEMYKDVLGTRAQLSADMTKEQQKAALGQGKDWTDSVQKMFPNSDTGWEPQIVLAAGNAMPEGTPTNQRMAHGLEVLNRIGTQDQLKEQAIAKLKEGRWFYTPTEQEIAREVQLLIDGAMRIAPPR